MNPTPPPQIDPEPEPRRPRPMPIRHREAGQTQTEGPPARMKPMTREEIRAQLEHIEWLRDNALFVIIPTWLLLALSVFYVLERIGK